jgi:hypothetical protein
VTVSNTYVDTDSVSMNVSIQDKYTRPITPFGRSYPIYSNESRVIQLVQVSASHCFGAITFCLKMKTVECGCLTMDDRRSMDDLIGQLRALQVRVAQLETAAPEPRTDSAPPVRAAAPRFKRGDRVFIKNKVKKPATWSNAVAWNDDNAKTATVSHIYKGQVHFVTDNGVKTWRAVNNLERIPFVN